MGLQMFDVHKKMGFDIEYKMVSNNKRWELVHWRLVTKSKKYFWEKSKNREYGNWNTAHYM
jgi:hypothetical protein